MAHARGHQTGESYTEETRAHLSLTDEGYSQFNSVGRVSGSQTRITRRVLQSQSDECSQKSLALFGEVQRNHKRNMAHLSRPSLDNVLEERERISFSPH